jgi:choline-sulfatase
MKATNLPLPGRSRSGLGPRLRASVTALAPIVAIGALGGLIAAGLPGCRPERARPDILLVTIDTLRADHCSAYGYPVPTTPNLDALAAKGVLFRRAYAESSTTAPSHAVLMTSRHFRTLGVGKNGLAVPADATTIAEALQDDGYQTAAFVSSFPLLTRFGFSQGFDVYDDKFEVDEASLGRRKPGSQAHDRLGGATLAHVERWLGKRNDSRPLFLWVHFVDPHAPYRAPERFAAKWPERTKTAVQRYDAEVHYADRQLGRLLEVVAKQTPDHDDFVVVTSDHGEGLGDHGWMSHGVNLHEEAVRIPLVASWPGHLAEGKVVEDPVALVDVARGILDVAGVDAKSFEHAREMFGTTDPGRSIFLQRRDYRSGKEKGHKIAGEMTAVVERGSKLILAPDEELRELYDLTRDPRELTDLLAAPGQASPKKTKRAKADNAPSQPVSAEEAKPATPAELAEREATAHRLEGTLSDWTSAFPSAGSDAPLDKETQKALRSLGYVE